MFCIGIVDRDYRITKDFIPGHAFKANHTCSCFLCSSDDMFKEVFSLGMQGGYKISPIIHSYLGFLIKSLIDMLVIALIILSLYGKNRNIIVLHQCCSNLILGAEGI